MRAKPRCLTLTHSNTFLTWHKSYQSNSIPPIQTAIAAVAPATTSRALPEGVPVLGEEVVAAALGAFDLLLEGVGAAWFHEYVTPLAVIDATVRHLDEAGAVTGVGVTLWPCANV